MPPPTLTPAARQDLIEIADYIAHDNRQRAASFIAGIELQIASLADYPGRFPARPELAEGLRVAPHGRYLIFFMERGGAICVVRILHQSRDLVTLAGRGDLR